MTDSRYPYTHAADFIRRVGPVSSSGVVLSRGDASAIRGAIAVAIQIEDFRLACMLADAELKYQESSEAVQKETERVLRAIRGGIND
jgi:hypothetical protein